VEGSVTTHGEVGPLQDAVATDVRTPSARFVIVIVLIVNDTTSRTDGFNVIRVFVDLIGPGTPEASDLTDVCSILKAALLKVDSRLLRVAVNDLHCNLDVKASLKRDGSYVADITFPGDSNLQSEQTSATVIALSFSSVAAVIFASVF
jgi:hypothetical protein